MKQSLRFLLLVVFAVAVLSSIYAQATQDLNKEELLRQIAVEKQLIREEAKAFLIDKLPGLMATDPEAADQALAKYSGMFNTMDKDDFVYLLGHFYARMGDNSKAISSFNTLLKTRLNEDARRMLNLVLYEQMITYLKNGDRKAAKEFLSVIIFENFNIDLFYPTYLYIWSDMSAEDGDYESVVTSLEAYGLNRETITNRLLPSKQQIIGRIQNLDTTTFFKNPTQDEYQKLVNQIDAIKIDLTNVYNEIISLRGIIYLNAVVRMHKEEMQMLDDIKNSLTEYLNNEAITDKIIAEYYGKLQSIKQFSDSYAKQINIMDIILQRQYERYLANDPSLQNKEYSDMELKRLYDIEKNIEIYDQILDELDTSIADPQLAGHINELQQMRMEYSEKRSDLQIRKTTYLEARKHSSDVQEQIFEAILNEYYALNADEKDLGLQIAELEQFFKNDAKEVFNSKMRKEVIERVTTQVAVVSDSNDRDEPIRNNVRDMLSNVDFIKLQLTYRNLRARETARLARRDSLSFEQLTVLQNEILDEKRKLIADTEQFIATNPNFQAIEQPDGKYLVGLPDMYYNLAELQYAVNISNPEIAIDSYRKVIQSDPNYYHKDAALYNIAFISSLVNRNKIDSSKNRFYELNASAMKLDEASRYKDDDFAEAIAAYQDIVDNHKDSVYYEESLYRLGLLNYYIGTDADDPSRNYTLATYYFDEIIANPTGKYRYDAIYQRGWLRLNTSKEEDLKLAMADFMTLLNAIENKQITDPLLIQDYRDDAVNNIAYCLIALDGLDFSSQAKGVAELKTVFANYTNNQIIGRVLDKAAKNKFDLDASLQAVDYMWLKIGMNPLALDNPALLDSILYIYASQSRNLRDGKDFTQTKQDLYINMIDNYGKDSAWFAANKDNAGIQPQLAVIKKAFDERGKRLYIEFTENPTDERLAQYKAHMNRFGAFVELHGESLAAWQQETDKGILVLSTTLAEKSTLPENYMTAISNLHAYNTKYPEDPDFFLNEGLSYTYANNVFNMLSNRYDEPGFVAVAGVPANIDDLYAMLSTNSLRFIEVMRTEKYRTPERDQEGITILLSLADIQYNRNKYADATTLYLKALEQEDIIVGSSKFDIYGKLATMAQTDKNYANSEMYFRKALPFAQTQAERKAINESIVAQIQLSYEASDSAGNYTFAATERLRLADELPASEEKFIQALRWTAQESYVKGKEYQKAIDLLLQVAGTKTDIDQVYTYYYTAWQIAEADSMMKNPEQANTIKEAFVAKYPTSTQAYSLKVADVKKKESFGSYNDAADAYLVLHEQAKNKAINTGEDTSDALMISAIVNYKDAKNDTKMLEVMKQFIALYPQHNQVIPYMEYVADDYLAKGDSLMFEKTAKDIFVKDKTRYQRYKRVADMKLYKLWSAFDIAYKNKDYTLAFKNRDEYKKVEAAYTKEGLTFDLAKEHDYFAAVQTEYGNSQKQVDFLRNFDNQLSALEKSAVMTASPASLITVNINTKWQTNLVGGNRRIPTFKASVNSEVGKVTKLLEEANSSDYDLDTSRRLKAQNLIARFYERGASVILTQIGAYMKTSSEAAGFRQEHKGEALTALINQVAYQQNSDLLDAEFTIHTNVYNLYQMAGYTDIYTQRSLARLQEMNLVPNYKTQEYPLNQSWVQKLDGSTSNLNLQTTKSPKGVSLGSIDIPAGKNLTVNRVITSKQIPDLALLQVVYPYDIQIKLNGTDIAPRVVPADTLEAGKPVTTRFAYLLPKEAWAVGQNMLEVKAPNASPEVQKLFLNLQLFTDLQKTAESAASETMMIYSDKTWRAVTNSNNTAVASSASAIIASGFGIRIQDIDGMENTPAKPIWVAEEAPAENVTLETDFNIDTEFKEGLIDFVAPINVTIYLNGTEIASNMAMDYEPDPLKVYSSQVIIDKKNVVNGKNTLKFMVNNTSQYRGFIAAVKIVKAGKEEIR